MVALLTIATLAAGCGGSTSRTASGADRSTSSVTASVPETPRKTDDGDRPASSVAASTPDRPGETGPVDRPDGPIASVAGVTDGDTLSVEVDGTLERVRLIGIDAPERW